MRPDRALPYVPIGGASKIKKEAKKYERRKEKFKEDYISDTGACRYDLGRLLSNEQ